MVSVSGFRGRVGNPLTPELVAGLAAAFGAFLQREGLGDTVCVGRDSRTSGPMFLRAVVAGLQSVGTRVVDLGVVPTPTLIMATEHHGSAGGIAITASHNSAEWNALKLALRSGDLPERPEGLGCLFPLHGVMADVEGGVGGKTARGNRADLGIQQDIKDLTILPNEPTTHATS